MEIEIYEIEFNEKTDNYKIVWSDLDKVDHEETTIVSRGELLDFIEYEELNYLHPNGQSDDEPTVISLQRTLEEFEDFVVFEYLKTV